MQANLPGVPDAPQVPRCVNCGSTRYAVVQDRVTLRDARLMSGMKQESGEIGGEYVFIEGEPSRPMSRWYNGEEGDPGDSGTDDWAGCTLCYRRRYVDPINRDEERRSQEADYGEDCPF